MHPVAEVTLAFGCADAAIGGAAAAMVSTGVAQAAPFATERRLTGWLVFSFIFSSMMSTGRRN